MGVFFFDIIEKLSTLAITVKREIGPLRGVGGGDDGSLRHTSSDIYEYGLFLEFDC